MFLPKVIHIPIALPGNQNHDHEFSALLYCFEVKECSVLKPFPPHVNMHLAFSFEREKIIPEQWFCVKEREESLFNALQV